MMEESKGVDRSGILCLCLCLAANVCFMQCDARISADWLKIPSRHLQTSVKSSVLERFGIAMPVLVESSNTQPYVSSPFSLSPYESLPPFPLPDNAPPFCDTPPSTPQPPSFTIPTPVGEFPPMPPSPPSIPTPVGGFPPSPPSPSCSTPAFPGDNPPLSPPETIPTPYPPSVFPNPPTTFPNPPTTVPSPPEYIPISPPANVPSPPVYEPTPPSYTPSPIIGVPSPPDVVPSPPGFLPPVVYPPPAVPPPPHTAPATALWCVAKPSVPEPIIQEAMNYACASGADCDQIKPNGSCFQPDTVLAHASYAFNSYWQRSKAAGGSCEFGGSAMLVTVDPSYDGCHFLYF